MVDTDRSSLKHLVAHEKSITLRDLRLQDIVPLGVCAALVIWLYVPVFNSWLAEWFKDESYYSHGVLVPFISGFLVWLMRQRLVNIPIRPDRWGYVILVLFLPVVPLMTWAGATIPQGLVFPIVVFGLSLVLLGREMTKQLWFPIAFLFFMCVLPGDILVKLSFRIQMLSTAGAALVLKLLSLDASREGAVISLPSITVQVGAPCSGFRLLISLFAFSSLFAYLVEGPVWSRLALVGITLPLSLVLNVIRITLIGLVGEFMGENAMHVFHDMAKFLIIIMAFIALWFIARWLKCQKFNSMLLS
ncbi:MAG: exosortase [Armatimonadota bacterium]